QAWLANINSPSQIVYSSTAENILKLSELCQSHQIRSTLLSASAAFHSELMAPAEKKFKHFLRDYLRTPKKAAKHVVACDPGAQYTSTAQVVENLSRQLTHSVDWIHSIRVLEAKSVKLFIEVGPKSVLTKLTQDIIEHNHICLSLDASRDLRVFLMPLWALGIELRFHETLSSPAGVLITTAAEKENKIIKGFIEKQQQLLAEASLLSSAEEAQARRLITLDTEEVLAQFFRIEGITKVEEPQSSVDPSTQLILSEISLLTGFKVSEIKIDARFDSDLYLDSMTKLELLSILSEKFKAEVSDMTALLNANSVRELNQIISKYKVTAPQEKLRDEVHWLKTEIINYTGISEDKLQLTSRFNEDLMLDSLIKLELIANLKSRFPHLDMNIEDLTRVNNLQEIQALLATSQSASNEENQEKKFSRSIKENLAHFLNLKLEKIQSTSDFEHDLRLNVFEKEDFINSLIIKHPYLQLAARELLHAKTLGDLLEIEEVFDRRSKSRRSEEEVSRYEFDFEEVHFKSNPLRMGVDEAFITIGLSQGLSVQEQVAPSQNFSFSHMAAFTKFVASKPSFTSYRLVLNLKHNQGHEKATLKGFIEELFEFCQALVNLNTARIAILFDSFENPLIKALPAALRSLSKEVAHSFRLVDMKLSKTGQKHIPWAFFEKISEERFLCLTQQGNSFYREVIKVIEAPRLKAKIILPPSPHILLVGGARGITSEIAKFLADHRQATLTAIGRTPLSPTRPFADCLNDSELRERLKAEVTKAHPEVDVSERNFIFNLRYNEVNNQREIWNTKESIESRGGVFHYITADASQAQEFEKAIKKIQREIGKIDGIIHAVGVTRDNLLKHKSIEDFRHVVFSKIASAYNVFDTFADEKKLSFVCFFSSLSSWSGAPGQTDYSYANEVLNLLAIRWNEKASYPVASLLWSVWSETGLAQDNLLQRMQDLKLTGISNRAGIRLFKEEVLHHGLNHSKVLFTPKSTLSYSLGRSL
ncbi:MAG: SDR family NAD(P)-dependent oxidoreductase, partial [Proteobacteria bacterium]|nr:SDR family NAD(P)-dependent oxidoreductase [Pseudomonadota bacterium]